MPQLMKPSHIHGGDVQDATPLGIGAKTLSMTTNLEKMFQRLRLASKISYSARDHDPTVPRRLWITQSASTWPTTRSGPTRSILCADIYENAKRSLNLAGEAYDDSDLAMDTIMFLDIRAGIQPFISLLKLHGSRSGEHINPQDPRQWVVFQRLMERPWW